MVTCKMFYYFIVSCVFVSSKFNGPTGPFLFKNIYIKYNIKTNRYKMHKGVVHVLSANIMILSEVALIQDLGLQLCTFQLNFTCFVASILFYFN